MGASARNSNTLHMQRQQIDVQSQSIEAVIKGVEMAVNSCILIVPKYPRTAARLMGLS